MAKIKVKRKDAQGTEAELEVEEAEVKDTDIRIEPAPAPGKPNAEKTIPESEHNQQMAALRRQHTSDMNALRGEFDAFKQGIADKEKAANDAAAKKVEALRADLPESITKLLDKLSPVEQLEWLSDPANVIEKKNVPPLPGPSNEPGKAPRTIQVI